MSFREGQPEQLLEGVEVRRRERQEPAALFEHAVGDERVDVRMEVERASEGLDRRHHPGQRIDDARSDVVPLQPSRE